MEFEAAVWRQPQHRGYLTVEQVWFPGVHANIGGGYEDRGLSDLTLDWMIKRLRKYCPEVVVSTAGLQPNHHGTLYDPRSWLYWRSIWRPLMRLINRCALKDCRGMRLASVAAALQADRRDAALERAGALHGDEEGRARASATRRPICARRWTACAQGTTLIVGADGEPGQLLPPSMRPTAEMRLH